MTKSVESILAQNTVLPVLTVNTTNDALSLAEALLAGNISAVEITLRTPCALDAITAISHELPRVNVGAGTILSVQDAKAAALAGSAFLVSPGIVPELLENKDSGISIPYLPGIATPSEMMRVFAAGLTEAKLFPAEAVGGVKLLKAIASPLSALRFCPTGGINQDSYSSYLALPNVFSVGGSWMVPNELVKDKAWPEITKMCLNIQK